MDRSVRAWYASWSIPAAVLMGGSTPKGKGAAPARKRGERADRGDILDWVPPTRDSRGNTRRRRIIDLREMLPIDEPWDADKVMALKGMMGGKGRTLLLTRAPPGLVRPPRP